MITDSNYSPDYESEEQVFTAFDGWQGSFIEVFERNDAEIGRRLSEMSGGIVAERARLEREVVEAALRLRRSTLALKNYFNERDGNDPSGAMGVYKLSDEDVGARVVFNAATDALLKFESKQK